MAAQPRNVIGQNSRLTIHVVRLSGSMHADRVCNIERHVNHLTLDSRDDFYLQLHMIIYYPLCFFVFQHLPTTI